MTGLNCTVAQHHTTWPTRYPAALCRRHTRRRSTQLRRCGTLLNSAITMRYAAVPQLDETSARLATTTRRCTNASRRSARLRWRNTIRQLTLPSRYKVAQCLRRAMQHRAHSVLDVATAPLGLAARYQRCTRPHTTWPQQSGALRRRSHTALNPT
jgi:hypothetical protein